MTVLFLPGRRQRTKRPAMERILQREQAPLGFVTVMVLSAGKCARQLERALPSFSAAVAEKRFVQAGDFCQPLRQLRLVLVEEQIRHVDEAAGLALQS